MKALLKQVTELEKKVSSLNLINESVSKASVGWHIEHLLLAIVLTIKDMQQSNPINYKWKYNPKRTFVLTFKYMPRGTGKAGKLIQPKLGTTAKTLNNFFVKTKSKIKELEGLNTDSFSNNPALGKLKKNDSIKFMKIHTKHHVQIINDIEKLESKKKV